MMWIGALTLTAFLVLGRAATKRPRSAPLMAFGLLLFVVSGIFHVAQFEATVDFSAAVATELGIGSWLLAGMLSRHRQQAKPWFFIGGVALTISVALLAFGRISESVQSSEWLLELGPDDSIEEVSDVLDRYDIRFERAFPTVDLAASEDLAQVWILRGQKRDLEKVTRILAVDTENVDHLEANLTLQFLDDVDLASPVISRSASILENDPLANEQWGLDAIRGHEAHAQLRDASPARKARVAVLDTGVDGVHEDLGGIFERSPASVDRHGHGSHVAGLAGAATNNGVGIASLNWEGRFVEVSGYQALADNGSGSLEQIAQAIVDATQDGVDVISMSLGARVPTAPKIISDAVAFAVANNVIVLASAGNANEDAKDHIPSNVPGVIVVSAVDENLRKATFSNTNTSLSWPITAPGVNMLSLKASGGYVQMSGTSMSTPVVSGLVGVMRSFQPDLTAQEAYDILASTGRSVKDSKSIGKLIDADAAISAVRTGQ